MNSPADLAAITAAAATRNLSVLGGFHPQDGDDLPGTGTLLLLGPAEPGFWSTVSREPEFSDGAPDPLDRWSERVITGLATDLGAGALFPFGRSPALPFFSWALRTNRTWSSPVRLLIHAEAGLWVSFRGALAFGRRVDLPPPLARPCDTCRDKPCLSACPATALTGDGYDLAACHGFLDKPAGRDCMERGCRVRAACPVSRQFGRDDEQSAFHMRAFHP